MLTILDKLYRNFRRRIKKLLNDKLYPNYDVNIESKETNIIELGAFIFRLKLISIVTFCISLIWSLYITYNSIFGYHKMDGTVLVPLIFLVIAIVSLRSIFFKSDLQEKKYFDFEDMERNWENLGIPAEYGKRKLDYKIETHEITYIKPKLKTKFVLKEPYIISSQVNTLIWDGKMKFDVSLFNNQRFVLAQKLIISGNIDNYLRVLKSFWKECNRKNKRFTNDLKIGMLSDLYSDTSTIRLYKTRFFLSYLTNEICTKRWIKEDSSSDDFGFNNRFPKEGGKLLTLRRSSMNNHIGVSTIAFSSDNILCLWRQNNQMLQSEGLLAPTGSGSADWPTDLNSTNKKRVVKFNDILKNAMERELTEESNKLKEKIIKYSQIEKTVPLGYFRWVKRGGKPEFVGVTKLKISSKEISPNEEEVLFEEGDRQILRMPAQSPEILLESINKLEKLEDLSLPLKVNLIVLKDSLLSENSEELRKLLFEKKEYV